MQDVEDGARRGSAASTKHAGPRVLDAARRGNAAELQDFLLAGLPVDSVDDVGKQIMHYVARYGLLVPFHALMAVDPSQVNSSDDGGNKPLHCAAEKEGNLPVLEALLEQRINVDVCNNEGLTPLHVAAFCGNAAAVTLLHARGAALETRTEALKTPLHLAARNGHSAAVKALLDGGAEVTAECKGRYTPLHLAASSPSCKAVEMLLVGGADENTTTETGAKPLYFAAAYGRLQSVEVLVNHHAATNDVDMNGRSAMHCAALNGHTCVVLPLVHAGAMLDMEDNFGNAPLHYASMSGHLEMVCLLVHLNADIMVRNKLGEPPLHIAAQKGHLKVVEQLCVSRAELHACDEVGNTACHVAASHGHSLVLQHLLSLGAPLNRQNEAGDTCLHLAAQHNCVQCVRVLLHSNANLTVPNKRGEYAMTRAGAIARPLLEDWQSELSSAALMSFGPADDKHTPIVVFGETEAGKSAWVDSLIRHKSNPGLLHDSETIISSKHQTTLGVHVQQVKLGGRLKAPMRIVEIGGHRDFGALRAPCLRMERAIHVLVLSQQQTYEEQQAHATAWLDLARVCASRTSLGRALRLRAPLLLVFSHADTAGLRITKNPKNNMNTTNVADRLFSELQPMYKEWFDFGPTPFVMDCRVPFSTEMDVTAERLFFARKMILKESIDSPRVVAKVEALLPKIARKLKQPWVSWRAFKDEVGKKFFHGEDRDRIEAEIFIRRIVRSLHDDLKVVSFSTGPAKDFIVLDTVWFFDKVIGPLMSNGKRPTQGMKPLTADQEGHMFISEFEAILAPLLCEQPMDGMLAILAEFQVLCKLPGNELRVLMPSWISMATVAPRTSMTDRSVFAGRRLKLGGVTARCGTSLINALVLGLLDEYPGFRPSIWPLGIRLFREVNGAAVEISVELGEQRSHGMLLVYATTNLVPRMAVTPLKALVGDVLEVLQLGLQAQAPSVSVEIAPLSENQLPQVRRGSMDVMSGNVLANRNAALARAQAVGPLLGAAAHLQDNVHSPTGTARRERRLSSGTHLTGTSASPRPDFSPSGTPRLGTPNPADVPLEEYVRSPGGHRHSGFVYGVDETDKRSPQPNTTVM